ncbi:MAG TPA: hypothetical protein VNN22_14780 [Verrucomicrobiae bacterium]|nr:hypothetical protein [Verrucomicrobiae bacterium]
MKFLRRSFSRWLGLFIVTFQLAAVAAESPWQRVMVIGASASAGFVLSEPFGGTNTDRCRLNRYLDAAITVPHSPVENLASPLLFMNPEGFAPVQIAAAKNGQPTLVVGLDFLFWFCYGDAASDAERAQRFEGGLKLLEQIRCPLVVGDIPDVSFATNTGIIRIGQVPGEAARQAANRRLQAWAAGRPQVTVMPLAAFMRNTIANRAIAMRGQKMPAGQTRSLLQGDQLHPNPRGAAVLALGALEALSARQAEFPASAVRWNLDEVLRAGGQLPD